MMTLEKTFPKNELGRDFVCGDIHGCYEQLMLKLEEVGFDFTTDRLFCTGDLADRGPDSEGCIRLLMEPWFFAAQGNHDRMLLTFALGIRSEIHSGSDLIPNGGQWVYDPELTPESLRRLAELILEKMPLVINVKHDDGDFIVCHSRYHAGWQDRNIDSFVWDRHITDQVETHANNMGQEEWSEAWNGDSKDIICLTDVDYTKPLVYVGHNIVKKVLFLNNHIMLDTGSFLHPTLGKPTTKQDSKYGITVVEHSKVAKGLGYPSNV